MTVFPCVLPDDGVTLVSVSGLFTLTVGVALPTLLTITSTLCSPTGADVIEHDILVAVTDEMLQASPPIFTVTSDVTVPNRVPVMVNEVEEEPGMVSGETWVTVGVEAASYK